MRRIFTKRGWLDRIDPLRIEAAIQAAEQRTTGELCVSVAPFFFGRVERAAARAFDRLGVRRTPDRNGVLFFVVPSRRKLVLLGDRALHDRVGDPFWRRIVAEVSARFAKGDFTGGLLFGIGEVADVLAREFPLAPGEQKPNRLPDQIDRP